MPNQDYARLSAELYEEIVARLMKTPVVQAMAEAVPETVPLDSLHGKRITYFRDMVNAMYDLATDGSDYVRPVDAVAEAIFRLRRDAAVPSVPVPAGATLL